MKNTTTNTKSMAGRMLLSDLTKPGMVKWLCTSADGAQIGYCRRRRCLVAGYPQQFTLVPMEADGLIALSLDFISLGHELSAGEVSPC